MSSRDELQTLKRGLQALAILNTEGPANVACIAKRLDVPRANAHRIINTLAGVGYCRKVPNSHLYIVKREGRELLSSGSLCGLVSAVGIDIIEDLSRTVKWPLAVATPHGATMVTRVATHLSNPLALAKIAPGHVASVLDASTGVTYLARSRSEVRETVLAKAAQQEPSTFAMWRPYLPKVMETVQREGYFVMRRPEQPEGSLGVPVMLRGEPVAGIAMRYIKSAVARATVVEKYLPHLFAAALRMEEALNDARVEAAPPKVEPRATHVPTAGVLDWKVAANG